MQIMKCQVGDIDGTCLFFSVSLADSRLHVRRRGLVLSQGPSKASKDPKRGGRRRRRRRGDENGGGRENGRPQSRTNAAGVPPSARALPGSAAICERDRSSFQKLFLLWDLGLGGDQTQTSREQEEQRPAAWRSVFFLSCRTSHTLTLTLTPPPFSQLSVCFPLDPLLLFPLSLLRGRERERFWTPRSIPRDFWSLSSWCCRLSPAIIGSVSLILLSPTSTGRAQTTTPSEPDRRRPAPTLHRRRLGYTTSISSTSFFAFIDDCSPALVTMTGENPATSAGHC